MMVGGCSRASDEAALRTQVTEQGLPLAAVAPAGAPTPKEYAVSGPITESGFNNWGAWGSEPVSLRGPTRSPNNDSEKEG
jgi:hypothetical protein